MRGNDYHWHIRVDQRYRAMLHLGSRIALSMNIRDFFQFQSAFQGYRIAESASQIQEIVGISKSASQIGHFLIRLQHFANQVRYLAEAFHYTNILIAFHRSPCLGKCQGKHGEHGDLTSESFRRGDTNLWSYMDVGTRIGGSRYAGANGIAHTIDKGSTLLCQLNSC